ncbi:MAG: hypothetical protein ABJ327_06530 [Litoreibacter sp.]
MIPLLIGVIGGVLIFAALQWSIYRAVVTHGYLRINAIVLSFATLIGMAGVSYSITPLVLIAAPACILFSLAQMMTDPRWSKLLPLVQFILGFIFVNILLFSSP